MAFQQLCHAVTRKKTLNEHSLHISDLPRCLGTIQLAALGIGSGVGTGVYVLSAHVARDYAGPSASLSFLIAGVSALLTALCYAEFAARIPKAGSAYIFTYVVLGELAAFIVGWTLLLDSILGVAALGKAWSQHLDVMLNETISKTLAFAEIRIHWFAPHPDILAFAVIWTLALIVLLGTKLAAVVNATVTLFTILVVSSFAVLSLFYADKDNWTESANGFFRNGVSGVLTGGAIVFYSYIGFEAISISAEEARKPNKQIPAAIFLTFVSTFLLTFGLTCITTLVIPSSELSIFAPLPNIFDKRHIAGARYIVATGGLIAMTSSLISIIFMLPRLMFSLARDGLIFNFFKTLLPRTNSLWVSIMLSGIFSSTVALVLRLDDIIHMLSVGTLLAYTCMALCVIVLRYTPGMVGVASGSTKRSLSRETTGLSGISQSSSIMSRPTEVEEETTVCVLQNPNSMKMRKSKSLSSLRKSKSFSESSELLTMPIGNKYSVTQIPAKVKIVIADENGPSTSKKLASLTTRIRSGKEPSFTYQKYEEPRTTIDGAIVPKSDNNFYNVETDIKGDTKFEEANNRSSKIVNVSTVTIVMLLLVMSVILKIENDRLLGDNYWWCVVTLCVLISIMFFFVAFIARQPQNHSDTSFLVPFVPFIPLLAVAINIFLVVRLPLLALVRFGVFLVIGMMIYFLYGIRHSREASNDDDQEIVLYDVNDKNLVGQVTNSTQ